MVIHTYWYLMEDTTITDTDQIYAMNIGRNSPHGDYSKALHFRFAAFSGPKVVAQSEISSGRTGREEKLEIREEISQ